MVLSWGDRPFGVPAGDDEHVLVVMPVASEHFTLELLAVAGLHRQHNAGLRNRLDLDLLAEPDVAVVDGFHDIGILAADPKRGNSEADLDGLRHVSCQDRPKSGEPDNLSKDVIRGWLFLTVREVPVTLRPVDDHIGILRK